MSEETLNPASADEPIELEDLSECTGLRREEVIELVELGVLETCGGANTFVFVAHTVIKARRAARLRDDFGLNTPGMALALTYLERIEQLEQRLRVLEASQPR